MLAAEFSLSGMYLSPSPTSDTRERPEDLPQANPEKLQEQDSFENFATASSK